MEGSTVERQEGEAVRVHTATARNFSTNTENRIHSDDVAARFGFAGALVPGAAVFGHMTRPLVAALGSDWLAGTRAELRLIKPAYHLDALEIHHAEADDAHVVRCHARGLLLAELRSTALTQDVDARAFQPGGAEVSARPTIQWDNVHVDEPFPSWTWTPDAVGNAEAAAQVEDDLPCYRDGLVHPHAILSLANRAFTRRYHLPAWIHVGSDVRLRQPLHVGEPVDVRTVPTRKWRRKGHELIELHIACLVAGVVAVEILHTSIFSIASGERSK